MMSEAINLAVIGGGQMGRALVSGMLAADVVQGDHVRLVDRNPASKQWWATNHPEVVITDLPAAVSDSDVVLLAVKPHGMESVAKQKGRFWNKKLVMSVAAGVSLGSLGQWIGHERVVRVMPNTPCLVGLGACGYCVPEGFPDADIAIVEAMLGAVGISVKVLEKQMDAVTGVSGSGPAYVFLMIEAMADGGVKAGLPRPLAMQLATQTVMGAAKMVAETGRHPGELKDSVASPGGTTIAALATLEHNGFRSAVIEAVAAAANRSRELGG
ncbi:pyrroline-5-carboxylate reductase [Rubripirellula lacrimiformis]|nr:pyrroline-5-carboxylate reductase [Rubripirellula lacrimiformis]